MKQVLQLLLLGLIITSCSKEEVQLDQTADARLAINTEKFDYTNLGVYKGTFAALGEATRGTVVINTTKDAATAVLTLNNGSKIRFTSKSTFTTSSKTETLEFNSNEGSFNFTVNANGTNPLISEVYLDATPGSIVVAKSTSTREVKSVTGTYGCDGCDGHPVLSDPDVQETLIWNLIFEADGFGEELVTSQVTFGTSLFISEGSQADPYAVIGEMTYCDLGGSFNFGAEGEVNWEAVHMFSVTENCTSIIGDWTMSTASYNIEGWLRSDSGCNPGDSDGKLTICHIPPGNPAASRTIEISPSAWAAHQAHGDSIGACD